MEGTLYKDNNRILLSSVNTVMAIPNLKPENIRAGINVGGVVGSFMGRFINPVLEENSWDEIKKVIEEGYGSIWLGQTKEITSGTYAGYHFQMVDATQGRYLAYESAEDVVLSKAVFQMVELPTPSMQMNIIETNSRGWYYSTGSTEFAVNMENLPSEIKKVAKYTLIYSGVGGSSTQIDGGYSKFFIPCEYEIFGQKINSIGMNEGSPQYQYYANLTAEDRIKYRLNESESPLSWYLRSPAANNNTNFCIVGSDGEASTISATTSLYLTPCFAI